MSQVLYSLEKKSFSGESAEPLSHQEDESVGVRGDGRI
jgi:hypothetical protein